MNYIGFKFMTRGKYPKEATVIDKLVTTNLSGEIVKTEYLIKYDFIGQIINDLVPVTTLQRAMIEKNNSKKD